MAEANTKADGDASSIPLWKTNGNENKLHHVLVQEEAVRNGLDFLRGLQQQLRLQLAQTPSAGPRLEKIDLIKNRKKDYKITIGFLGVTGAGKTSLINALLGFEYLLPTSDERACTSVAIEVAYNHNESAGKLFRGEIVFVTKDELERELEQLFTDIREQDSAGEDDDIEDEHIEREKRIAESLDKLKCIYPGMNTVAKLKKSTMTELLNHPSIQNIVGTTREIFKDDKDSFARILQEYTESSEYKGKTGALWPLVKTVKVFVKAEILKEGIIFVDLPGSMDTNVARAVAAEKYQQELSVTCVVSPAIRAISEKNAQDLLQKYTKRNLQLDGRYNAKMLCFILSKTDISFDPFRYSKQHQNLDEALQDEWKTFFTFKGKVEELERAKRSLKTACKKKKTHLRDLQRQATDIKFYLGEHSPAPKGRKRVVQQVKYESAEEARSQLAKLNDLFNTTKNEKDKMEVDIASLERRIGLNENTMGLADSRIRKACINYRNELSALAIRANHEATLKEMEKESTTQLQVFGVAAEAYFSRVNNPRCKTPGFSSIQDTQIPALRDWLISTTLHDREKYAQAFLHDVDQFLCSIKPWISNVVGDVMLTQKEKAIWSSAIEQSLSGLRKKFGELSSEICNAVRDHIQGSLYPRMIEAQRSAGLASRRTAATWTHGVGWSTHRKTNQRHGTWVDYRRREHKWNDDLAHDFTSTLLVTWNHVLFDRVPKELDEFVLKGADFISEFVSTVGHEDLDKVAPDGLELLKEHILRTPRLLKDEIEDEKNRVSTAIRASHRLAIPAIERFLIPMYEKCGAEKGRGHYQRNKATHQSQMQDGSKVHEAGRLAIENSLESMIRSFPDKLEKRYRTVIDEIQTGIDTFFENSTKSGRSSKRKAVSNSKLQLQKSVQPLIDKLEKAWRMELLATRTGRGASADEGDEDDLFMNTVDLASGSDEEDDGEFLDDMKLS